MKKSLLFTIISIGAVFALAASEPQLRPTTGGSVSGLDNSGQLSFNDLTGCRIATVDLCDWTWNDADGTFSLEKTPYNGGWMTTFTPSAISGDGHVVIEGFYGDIALPVTVDYHASKVTLKTGVSLASGVSYEQQGELQIKREQNVYIVPEECLWSDDADLADINGMIDNDGSVMFETGFTLYIEEVATSINRETQAVVSTDTIGALSPIFRNMCFRVPNGIHEFAREDQKVSLSEDAWNGIKDELVCASSVEEGSESVFLGVYSHVVDLDSLKAVTEQNLKLRIKLPILDGTCGLGGSSGRPIKPGPGSGGEDVMGSDSSRDNLHNHLSGNNNTSFSLNKNIFDVIEGKPGRQPIPIKPRSPRPNNPNLSLSNDGGSNHSLMNSSGDQSGDYKYQVPVYMYQTEDGDLYVYNMYGMSCVRNYMNIHSDGTMTCPVQTIGYDDESGEKLLNCSADVETWNNLSIGNAGEATPDCIEWDVTIPCAQSGLLSTMFTGNKLYYTNGDQFVIPAAASNLWDLNNDGMVNISDVTDLIDHLLNGKKSDVNGNAIIFSITDVTDLIDMLLQEK